MLVGGGSSELPPIMLYAIISGGRVRTRANHRYFCLRTTFSVASSWTLDFGLGHNFLRQNLHNLQILALNLVIDYL